jgi:hypothetical protein
LAVQGWLFPFFWDLLTWKRAKRREYGSGEERTSQSKQATWWEALGHKLPVLYRARG